MRLYRVLLWSAVCSRRHQWHENFLVLAPVQLFSLFLLLHAIHTAPETAPMQMQDCLQSAFQEADKANSESLPTQSCAMAVLSPATDTVKLTPQASHTQKLNSAEWQAVPVCS